MPRIAKSILDCVVYMYPSEAEAEDGVDIGGTGFLVSVPAPEMGARRIICLMTNQHTIDGGATTARLNTVAGAFDIIPLDQADWVKHPLGDDITVCPIGLDSEFHRFSAVAVEMFLSPNHFAFNEVREGSDVFLVGRFLDHEGRQRNTPTVRFGHVAQMDYEPISCIDQNTGEKRDHLSYVVQCFSAYGFSGSPVFVWFGLLPNWEPGLHSAPIANGPFLLGVQWGQMGSKQYILDANGKVLRGAHEGWHAVSPHISAVCPAHRAIKIFETEEFMRASKKEKDASNDRLERRRGVVEQSSSTQTSDKNPTHREDFTRLLGEAARKREQED